MKLKTAIFLSLVTLTATGVFAQKTEKPKTAAPATDVKNVAKPEKMPNAAEILTKYVQAIGGRAANEKIKTRYIKGTFDLAPMGVKGDVESYTAAPGKSYTKSNLQGIGEIIEGTDGATAWSSNPLQGTRDKTGDELVQSKLINNFNREINLDKLYSNWTVKGVEKVGDKDAYVLTATSAGLAAETFYFDKQTGLLLRTDGTLISPEGNMAAKSFFEDYREVDGVKMPFKTRVVLPQYEITNTLLEVKHGVTIDEAKFAKPKQ